MIYDRFAPRYTYELFLWILKGLKKETVYF
jgi:hypothetical protein